MQLFVIGSGVLIFTFAFKGLGLLACTYFKFQIAKSFITEILNCVFFFSFCRVSSMRTLIETLKPSTAMGRVHQSCYLYESLSFPSGL